MSGFHAMNFMKYFPRADPLRRFPGTRELTFAAVHDSIRSLVHEFGFALHELTHAKAVGMRLICQLPQLLPRALGGRLFVLTSKPFSYVRSRGHSDVTSHD